MSPVTYLREWRIHRGLSYRVLAKLSGVALSGIQNIETGSISPRVETLERLAAALGIDFHSLFKKPRETQAKGRG